MDQRDAAERIAEFLDAHPDSDVTVAVGYASVKGIVWLSNKTRGRHVTLFIGDGRSRHFDKATDSDRRVATAFLRRDDVEVKNWYRRRGGASAAHLKVWVAHTSPPAVLSGSANLTEAGLFNNREIMAEVAPGDIPSVVESVRALTSDAWDYKKKLIRIVEGSAEPRPGTRSGLPPQRTQRPRPGLSPPVGAGSRRGGCARIVKGCGTVALALVLLLVVVAALSRGCGDGSDTSPLASETTTPSPPRNPTSTSGTVAERATVAASAATTTVPEEEAAVLTPLVAAYAETMRTFPQRVDDLVREMNRINQVWENRDDGSDIYAGTEASLVAVIEEIRAFADAVRYQRVPIALRGIHGEPGGPLRLADRLAALADAVLDRLRISAPDERLVALQDFNGVADDFKASVERVLRTVTENTEPGGILTVSGQTTTTRARLQVELVDDAVTYVEGLAHFRELLDGIVADANAVNEAWDNRVETGVSYWATESSLEEIADRAHGFYEQVQDQPVPNPVRGLGEGPKREAPRVADTARDVLAGLRISATDPGFERLSALDDLNAAAQAFHASVDHVVYEVYAKAHTSGLAADT